MKSVCMLLAGLALAASPALAVATSAPVVVPVGVPEPVSVADILQKRSRGASGRFYEERAFAPLWVDGAIIGQDAQTLLRYLDSADIDGLRPGRYKSEALRRAIARADSGDSIDLARAELEISKIFARYVRDMRKVRDVGIIYADPALKPAVPEEETLLRVAGRAESFSDYMAEMGWMSPHYVRMRNLLVTAEEQQADDALLDALRLNLERARHLPPATVRHIVVDSVSARLWYYQGGAEVGSMKVVVGTRETQTPLMAGSLNYAILNPYWNVPDYLVRENVARKILAGRTLKSMKMEALSDWSATPERINPESIDWGAVADGRNDVRVRELPGPHNSMGKVKFIFPNDHGIYLHDTPNRKLFAKPHRHFSNGCIRLEKAAELGKWMLGQTVKAPSKEAEQAVPLSATVPVYLTYLTAMATKDGVALAPDVYGLDGRAEEE